MYVANYGSYDLSVVDLANNVEVRRIAVPPRPIHPDGPFSIAIANNGKALFSTTFAGSGFGARMMELDLSTDAVTHRMDFWSNGSTTERTFLDASGDRSKIGIVVGDASTGPVLAYTAATNSFSRVSYLDYSLYDIALNGDGSRLLVSPTNDLLDANLNLLGSIRFGGIGVAIDRTGLVGYTAYGSNVHPLDLDSFARRDALPLGDTVDNGRGYNSIGRMALSADGSLLAVITDHGFSLVTVAAPPNQPPDCSAAAPSITEIWPPDHKMLSVEIFGVSDPDGDPTSIVITATTQDEPVNGLGDADTSPDAAGVGTDTAQVRAERAGTPKLRGDGRMYHIHFDASDGKGGACSGVVDVGVPHDQRLGHVVVDAGELFDSTVP